MKTISSREIRNQRMQYIDAMKAVKPVKLLPVLNVATLSMVAEFLETDYSVVSSYYSGHKEELGEYGIVKLNFQDFVNAGYKLDPDSSHASSKIVSYNGISARVTAVGARCMSELAVYNMALGICKSEVAEKIKAAAALAETESRKVSMETEADTIDNVVDMASDILTFTSTEFGSIRVMEIDGNPWFVGKDVAESLGYGKGKSINNAVAKHVDDEDKGVTEMMTPGGKQKTVIINESGLYSLIMSSKLPTARQFKRWVTSEVLPSVRKNGGYIAGQEELTEAELMAKALLVAQKAIEDREKRIAELSVSNKAMSDAINTWDKKSVINALIRTYGGRCFNGDFKAAFADFYRQFNYKYGTNLKARRTRSGDNKSLIDYMTEFEKGNAVKLAVAICESRDIDTGSIINQANAAAYGA